MDITEQRALREEFGEVAKRLPEADRRKDEFLATLDHELRNSLAPIRTGIDTLQISGNDDDSRERVLRMMVRQTNQIVHLVDDLLDVSRVTRGKMKLRRSRVDLAVIVQSAIEATKALLAEAGHELSVRLPESSVYLHADPTRLSQVLSNLLNNAAKYTESPGRISLTVDAFDEEVVISVADNGKGIPAGSETRIFELFEQASRAGAKEFQSGLGIGLTLVKSLVDLHGGSVEVFSNGPRDGSAFTVRLPRNESSTAESDESTGAKQEATMRILIVDDNQEAAETLAMLIELLGNDVRTAGDGYQAVKLAAEYLPDVIFMDIGMPRMDGNEAARRIRSERWGRQMKLVALTGWGQEKEQQRTRAAGFDAHLVKPAGGDAIKALLADYSAALSSQ